MSNIAKFDAVSIPNVKSVSLTPELIADESRTASTNMNRDVSGVKRRWKLTASKLTPTERDAILGLLLGKMYGAVAFWLDTFGAEANTVNAYVTIDAIPRIPFGRAGTWYSDGCDMEMTITEK